MSEGGRLGSNKVAAVFEQLLRAFFVLAFCSLVAPFSLHARDSSLKSKVQAPITVAFETNGVPAVGQTVRVQVTVVSKRDLPQLDVELRLPAGVAHRSGELHWRGRAVKNGKVRLNVEVELLDNLRSTLVLTCGLSYESGARFFVARELVLAPPGVRKPDPPGQRRIVPGSSRVLEHQGVER